MLVPGFRVRELPVKITSLNNVEYAPDGRLFAGGYDGRFHLLRDRDGDGLEDQVQAFWPETSPNYPLGMVVKDGALYAVLTDEVVRFVDTDGDGVPDKRETVVKGFDDPALQDLTYLNHRRVDSSMALAFGPDGAMYVTMGNAGYNNAYWQDGPRGKGDVPTGTPHYSTDKRRGCLLRFSPDGKVEQLASGLRYIMSLQFNRHGDLFGTDQEGATWVPNGNPFDELLHLEAGRHYGFPPRHPQYLPDVVDEPSVWDYSPQHESTCGFRFNGPSEGRGRFGPETWSEDAIVTGEARGRLWRTKLARTAAGYVGQTQLIARIGLLAVDCAISAQGDLLVSCHTGKPDWGNGPQGAGRLFKITFVDKNVPQPIVSWAASETETAIAFDRPVDEKLRRGSAEQITITSGRFVDAGDRYETIRPGYAVVQMQQREKPEPVEVRNVRVSEDRRTVTIESAPRKRAVNYALRIKQSPGGTLDMMNNLCGVAAQWRSADGKAGESLWLPHPDFVAAREFTRGSAKHEVIWKQIETAGALTIRGQLDLWKMLTPLTQPGSDLGYIPEPEVVTVGFKSDARVNLYVPGVKVATASEREASFTVVAPAEGKLVPFTATLTTPASKLDVSYYTARDKRPRALPIRRCLMPFAEPATTGDDSTIPSELSGGNWEAGRALFTGKGTCATCHRLRGDGVQVGPDLGNLVHRDYASVLADIVDPNAAINPDAAGYTVTTRDGTAVVGTRLNETPQELQLAQPGGAVAKLRKSDIVKTEPLPISLMPAGLDKLLTKEELRDLMTYLLRENSARK